MPDSLKLQKLLAGMRDRGATAAVLECTPEASSLGHLDWLDLDVAIFTNFSPAAAELLCGPGGELASPEAVMAGYAELFVNMVGWAGGLGGAAGRRRQGVQVLCWLCRLLGQLRLETAARLRPPSAPPPLVLARCMMLRTAASLRPLLPCCRALQSWGVRHVCRGGSPAF
jgi:hypothetical protein